MEANKLRVGNYVFQKHLKKIDKVNGIREKYLLTTCKIADDNWVGISLYNGIPITEDILYDFGFEYNEGIKQFQKLYQDYPDYECFIRVALFDQDKSFMISLTETSNEDFGFDEYGLLQKAKHTNIVTPLRIFNYVHELQNFYNSITGNDLTLVGN